MSHVASVSLEVKDLECLEKACNRLGLEFHRGQTSYRWYGKSVGDYPLPAGITEADLGKCHHAISVPASYQNPDEYLRSRPDCKPYEIGVVQRTDGKQGYQLLWDFFAGGYGLESFVGADCAKLKSAYAAEVAKKHGLMQGFAVREQVNQDGSIKVFLTK